MKFLPMMLAICSVALLAASKIALAEPTSEPLTIELVRGYKNAIPVSYIYTSTPFCNTTAFEISKDDKNIYATALTALITGKKVMIEANGCTGDYTKIQSIFIQK